RGVHDHWAVAGSEVLLHQGLGLPRLAEAQGLERLGLRAGEGGIELDDVELASRVRHPSHGVSRGTGPTQSRAIQEFRVREGAEAVADVVGVRGRTVTLDPDGSRRELL